MADRKLIRLVIVEDSQDDALLLLRELKQGGYEPDYCLVETAPELKDTLEKADWDLVISDHALPEFSAPEALVVLNDSGKELPFIIVSSIIGEEVAVAAMKAGAHDYIMKNNLVRLVPVVERALHDAQVKKERKKAKEALRESEERFRRLAENVRDMIYRITLRPEKTVDYVSSSIFDILGYTPSEAVSNPAFCRIIFHPEDSPLIDQLFRAEIDPADPLILRLIKKDGAIIWVELRNVPVYDQSGVLVAMEGIARDITERILQEQHLKNSHAQIEALSARVLGAMEEERARLARELHDELGQALTAVKLDLQLMAEGCKCEKRQHERVEQSIKLIDYTINLVRRQSVSLRPPALDDMGLLPAVKEMAFGFSRRTGIKTIINHASLPERLSGHLETALYRCVQESLTNVARHSCASQADVNLVCEDGFLYLSVNDNGIGFEPENIKISPEHIGLTGMQERIKLLSGQFRIMSSPGEGTGIEIKVPLSSI